MQSSAKRGFFKPHYSLFPRHEGRTVLPKPIPPLTEEQWEFIAKRLEQPAPEAMQKRLREAIENAKNIKRE